MAHLAVSVRGCSQHTAGRNGWTLDTLSAARYPTHPKPSLPEPNPERALQANVTLSCSSRMRREARCELWSAPAEPLPASIPSSQGSGPQDQSASLQGHTSKFPGHAPHIPLTWWQSCPEQGSTLHEMQSCDELTFCPLSGNTAIASLAEIQITFWSLTGK